MLHDVFICHASEDKDAFVRPLAEALRSHHIEVWYDEFSLSVGDSLREAIDRGLVSTRFGIVVLSSQFFQKRWANHELNGLVSRQLAEERKLVLPIWHNVDRDEVLRYSPPLADIVSISSASGIEAVVGELLKKIRPEESPLITARNYLIEKGVSPPVISDEWWLDIVEAKEADLLYPDLNQGWRWIFPLPFGHGSRGRERGIDIAATALQLNWASDAATRNICQLTHPDLVHDFLMKWPGLHECAHDNPKVLALYAPQLTIPGFDEGFADVFDEQMSRENRDSGEVFRYHKEETIDGESPLCGDLIAWRHPSFGNYKPAELSKVFATAHDGSYSRQVFSGFECLIWLLSDGANWMPEKLRTTLKQGFRERVMWWIGDGTNEKIAEILLDRPRSRFAYTKTLRNELLDKCICALQKLELVDDPNEITAQFIEYGFYEGFYEEQDRIRAHRTKRA